jgi:hypothetical protein
MTKSMAKNKKETTPPLPQDVGGSAVRGIWELYCLARRGRMDVQKACRLTYMLSAMVKAHEHSELERRLQALESRAAGKA